jgi:hypothetical protein
MIVRKAGEARVARVAMLGAVLAVVVSGPASAQTGARVVRGINGSWETYPQRAAGLGSPPRAATIPAPAPIPEPPLKPEHLEKWRADQARNAELTRKGLPPVSSGMACLPEGMPGMMQATFPMEVLETPGQVTIIQEAYSQVRRIHLDEEPPAPADAEPRFAGHSAGKWEGDTLVVRTVGVKEYARFRNTPHSMNMRITERIRLINDEFMENQVTIEDPEYLTRPWSWTWIYRRWPGYKIQEYVCEDNRYFEDPSQSYQRLRVQ